MKALLCSCASLVLVSKVSSCTTERRVFFVTRKVQGKCQEVAGNVTSKILRNVSAGIGRSWLCVGQGQCVFERKRKTEMMTMCGSDDSGRPAQTAPECAVMTVAGRLRQHQHVR